MVDGTPLRVGMISEVYGGTTPPEKYGGISASVHDLSEEFVRRGHWVTLFAPEGSWSSGRLVVVPKGDRTSNVDGPLPPYVGRIIDGGYIRTIDVWIDGTHHKQFARYCKEAFPGVNVLCPSWNPNREDCPQNTVVQSPHMIKEMGKPEDTPFFYGGIRLEDYEPQYEADGNSVSINVLSVYKGTDLLVKAAAEHGFPVDLYGPCSNQRWFKKEIAPHIQTCRNIRWLGECGKERIDIMRDAVASFTLATWPEPGSRASIESFACGCPVIALPSGCFPYYIESDVNGVLCEGRDPDSIYDAYKRVIAGGSEMRRAARRTAEEKFDIHSRAENYEALFKRMMEGDRWA